MLLLCILYDSYVRNRSAPHLVPHFKCVMKKAITYIKKINLCKTRKSRYWSNVSTATTGGTVAKNLYQSVPKGRREENRKKQERLLQTFLRCTQKQ